MMESPEKRGDGEPIAGAEGDAERRPDRSRPAGKGQLAAPWAEGALARITDPASSLPPAAQRVLAGAMHVLVTKGFGRLTIANISAASGENVAAVKYYFGNKAGLIDALLETVIYNELKLLARQRKASRANGLSRLAHEILVLSTPDRSDRILWELLPHALRDKRLRQHLRRYYESFFELHLEQLGAGAGADPETRARMSGFAMILSAVADGLTIQAMVAPQHFDFEVALRALDELVAAALPGLLGGEPDEAASLATR